MTNFVSLFKSTDLNAPVLTGGTNAGVTVIDGCLVNGYGTGALTSITYSGTTGTATLGTADNTMVTGHYMTVGNVTGTNSSYYNVVSVITVQSNTSFTYTLGGAPTGTATTSSATYNRTPTGWAHPFTHGTNAQTYRSADASSNRFYLQVIDNAARTGAGREINFYGAEVMSADQTVTSGQFPTTAQFANGYGMRKSTTADTTARGWTLASDDRTFYLIPQSGDTGNIQSSPMGFGYFIPFKAADGYNTFVFGNTTFSATANIAYANGIGMAYFSSTPGNNGFAITRSYTQTGSAVAGQLTGYAANSISSQNYAPGAPAAYNACALAYPNPPDSGLYLASILILDGAGSLRGRLPGVYQPLHQAPFQNYDQITGVTGLPGVTLTAVNVNGNASGSGIVGQVLIDTFGPWN